MNVRSAVAPSAAILLAACGLAHATGTHTTIALTGTDGALGPNAGPGITFSTIGGQQPGVNSNGQVVFRASDSTANNPQGVYIHSGGVNSNVALAGGAQPGGGTFTMGSNSIFNSMQINASGQWAFRLGASTGLFASVAGTPTRAMLTGDAAPGAGGANYSSSASGMPLFNNAGHIGYIANLAVNAASSPPVVITSGIANAAAIWTGTPGATSIALRQNDAVLSLDAGGNVRVGSFQNLSLSMNGNGHFAVISNLQGSVTTGTGAGSNSAMISSNRSGSLEVIARVGNAAPDATGAASSDLYRALGTSAVGFNNVGHVAFASSLRNAAGTQTASSALFTDSGSGTLRMVARNGDLLPSISGAIGSEFDGVTWGTFSNTYLTGSDTLAFSATIGNTGGSGNTNVLMTMDASGAFHRVVRSGDVAIVDGAPLGGDARFTSFSNITVNAASQMAFSATLNGNGIFGGPGGNNNAIFGYDPAGGLFLLARTSDAFEVAPGDLRIISSIGGLSSTGGQDGRVTSLSENGKIALSLDFSDGSSGVFLFTIPAPASLSLLSFAGLVGLRRRR